MSRSPRLGGRMDMPQYSPSPPFDMEEFRDHHAINHRTLERRRQMTESGYFSSRRNAFSMPPFLPPGCEPDEECESYHNTDEIVRRTNLFVQHINALISPLAHYSQLQPKMCNDGRFPVEFNTPRTVEEIRTMDPSSLDRILRAYNLPTDLRSLRMTSNDIVGARMANKAKLCTLFDFLGAVQLAEKVGGGGNATVPSILARSMSL
ncbi:hypothetical protein M011DRAFT_151624 [Sporormia fimetaria CBS 119925]|uniref:Uncharacterized protein n=1 Tax=Sporormia fimetaria CBS 119925 TaxID=1340428 RepID=A0A6A6V7B2_9PLEO|nr:hypothetical protein M011DRAFT_151624 [Sporormia fimetaria CBS 119925]